MNVLITVQRYYRTALLMASVSKYDNGHFGRRRVLLRSRSLQRRIWLSYSLRCVASTSILNATGMLAAISNCEEIFEPLPFLVLVICRESPSHSPCFWKNPVPKTMRARVL